MIRARELSISVEVTDPEKSLGEIWVNDEDDNPVLAPQKMNLLSPTRQKALVDDLVAKSEKGIPEVQAIVNRAIANAMREAKAIAPDDPVENLKKPDQLIHHFRNQEIHLFHDQNQKAFVAYREPHGRIIEEVRSKFTRVRLAHVSNMNMEEAVSEQSIRTALNSLEATAIEEGEEHELSFTVAEYENVFFHDLREGRAVQITSERYDVLNDPPILFRKSPHFTPQVEPVSFEEAEVTDLWELPRLLNLKDEDNEILFILDLVAGLVPDIDKTISILHGSQGSGKSKAMEFKKRLLEPTNRHGELLNGSGINEEDFSVNSSQEMLLCYDNLTSLPIWFSNALCRFTTGGSTQKRARYTQDELHFSTSHGIAMLNGINLVANQPDLLDRSVIYELEPIEDDLKLTESDLDASFEAIKSRLLGSMYKALVFARVGFYKLDIRPIHRLTDWQKWITAIGHALGLSEEEINKALRNNRTLQNSQAIDASVIAQPLIDFIDEKGRFEGTMGALVDQLQDFLPDQTPKGFPDRANQFSRRLNEIKPDLKREGITVETINKEKRIISIYRE